MVTYPVYDLNVMPKGVNSTATDMIDATNSTILRATLQNTITQLEDRTIDFSADGGLFAEAYTAIDGRNGTVTEAGALFDTDRYKAVTSSTEPYFIIEADLLVTDDFFVNDCQIVKLATGKWQLSCNTGTDEEKRAKLYNTLFNGGASSKIVTSATNVTALKTNIARDVGKRGTYSTVTRGSLSYNDEAFYTGTFSDTTTNTSVSSWSYLTEYYYNYDNPSEFNTDTTADEQDNPANCRLRFDYDSSSSCVTQWLMPSGTALHTSTYSTTSGSSANPRAYVLILHAGDITWAYSGDAGASVTNFDSFSDGSIPIITAATEEYSNVIVHSLSYFSTPQATSSYDDATEFSSGSAGLTTQTRTGLSGLYSEVRYNIKVSNAAYVGYSSVTFTYYDSTTSTVAGTNIQTTSYSELVVKNPYSQKTVTGISLWVDISGGTVYQDSYSEFLADEVIGPFSSTFKNSFLTAKVADWEDGANIQYKLTNSSDDTGYGDYNEILSSGSAFTNVPDTLLVLLIPRSTNPTDGYPSIYGVGIVGDR